MNSEQERSPELGSLEESLGKLNALRDRDLVRKDQLGSQLDFKAGVPIFERTLQLFGELSNVNFTRIPVQVIAELKSSADSALSSFQEIQDFDAAEQQNPADVRDALIQHLKDQYDGFWRTISPVVAYCAQKDVDLEELEERARSSVSEIQGIKSSTDLKLREIMDAAENTLTQVRKAAAEVGVAQHSIHFEEEVIKHSYARRRWLWVTALLAVLIVALSGASLYYYGTRVVDMTMAQLVQVAISKAVFFSILSFALVWAGRVYKAESHNLVVNQHRQNALRTFEAFIAASGDESTKSAVLLQATQCIFSHQPSGFAQPEQEATSSPKVLEIIRNMMPGGGSQ